MALKTERFAATIPSLFWSAVLTRGRATALCEKKFGVWEQISWEAYGRAARRVGMALLGAGIRRGDCVAVMSEPNAQWFHCEMGAQGIGATSVGVYTTSAAGQVEYLLNDCRARIAFVEDDEQLDKFLEVRERCPDLRRIVVFDTRGLHALDDPMVISFDQFVADGEAADAAEPGRWEREVEQAEPDDRSILVYTSGTTGPPKGVMLSHRNVLHLVEVIDDVLPAGPADELLCWLPLSHIAERFSSIYRPLRTGAVVNVVESAHTFNQDLREVAPHYIAGVPRTWEKFYSSIRLALDDATPLERWAFERAMQVGGRVVDLRSAGKPVPAWLLALRWLAEVAVFRNVKTSLGLQRARTLISAAAPISAELLRWYVVMGLEIVEGYGQTESGAIVTLYAPHERRLGTVGKPMFGNEIRISGEGEILIRGPGVFMGYLNQPEKTAQTIDAEGWLHSGDVGHIDEDGYVVITDRMKDIIITAGGKNVTPSEIENQLKFSPYIADAIVIGDRRKYLTALIMIDHENVVKYAQDHSVPFTNFASLTQAAEVIDLIGREVNDANNRFNHVEQIKKFRLIGVQLTAEDEEMTPTMKLKRKLVSEKYADLIASMYSGTAP